MSLYVRQVVYIVFHKLRQHEHIMYQSTPISAKASSEIILKLLKESMFRKGIFYILGKVFMQTECAYVCEMFPGVLTNIVSKNWLQYC